MFESLKVDPDPGRDREVGRGALEDDIEVAGIRETIEIETVVITEDEDLDRGPGRGRQQGDQFHHLASRKYKFVYCCIKFYK